MCEFNIEYAFNISVESEGILQRIVDEFDRVCNRRKLKVNAGKSKVMVFKKAREQKIPSFNNSVNLAGILRRLVYLAAIVESASKKFSIYINSYIY